MLKPLKFICAPDHLWFISDLHIGHAKPFILEPRGFATVKEHDETLIARWNQSVTNEDTVFHLGDLMVGGGESKAPEYDFWCLLARLRFKHLYLLLGNHNARQRQAYEAAVARQFADLDTLQGGIAAEVYPLHAQTGDGRAVTFLPEYVEVSVAKQHLVLCHFPLASWHHMGHRALHLHGHTHSSLKETLPMRVDVGVEHFGRPVSLAQLLWATANDKPPTVDGHHSADPTTP